MHLNIEVDNTLFAKAQHYCGNDDPSAVIHFALREFVQCRAAKKLAALGGSEPEIADIPRNRPSQNEKL